MSFKEFLEQDEFVTFITEEFNKPVQPQKWSAGKDDVLKTWQQVRPDTPIFMQPVRDNSKSIEKSSYGEDGIRITGSWSFIASILSRLKDLLQFEDENTKLRLSFKGIENTMAGQQAFAFYVNRENRKQRKQTPGL